MFPDTGSRDGHAIDAWRVLQKQQWEGLARDTTKDLPVHVNTWKSFMLHCMFGWHLNLYFFSVKPPDKFT